MDRMDKENVEIEELSRGELGEIERLIEREYDGSDVKSWYMSKEALSQFRKELNRRRSWIEMQERRDYVVGGEWVEEKGFEKYINKRILDRMVRINRLSRKGVNVDKLRSEEMKKVFRRMESWMKYEDLFERIRLIGLLEAI